MRRLLLTLALLLVPAASAHAQADFSATLSAANPKFAWESTGSGAPDPTHGLPAVDSTFACSGEPFHCEYVLFKVEDAGTLALKLDSSGGQPVQGVPFICEDSPCASAQDIDAYLYKSDASGKPEGEVLSGGDEESGEPACASSFPSEACKVKVQPGHYVLEVEFFADLENTYTGTAELIGAVAAPAPPAAPAGGETPAEPQPGQPQSQPAPQQQPAQSPPPQQADSKPSAKQRRAACTKKAKKIKNKGKRKKALKRCKKIR